MSHNYRYLSPVEVQFYGIRSTAQFITTRKLVYKINGKRVTIPAGFVADGLEGLEQDFCSKPAWILFEFVYATHRLDYCAADR